MDDIYGWKSGYIFHNQQLQEVFTAWACREKVSVNGESLSNI
jgi:hypothetical protein